MSSSNPSDPRLLLPDWLRDGDTPLPSRSELQVPAAVQAADVDETVAVVSVSQIAINAIPTAIPPMRPYSDRLTLDTRLDPGQLVSSEDLPGWLGGLERTLDGAAPVSIAAAAPSAAPVAPIAEPEPYVGVDAPEDGVIDVQVNGWYLIVGAIGLLILLAAALRLYLS